MPAIIAASRLPLRAPGRYGPDDLAFAVEVARPCALVINNARVYRETRASEERFRTLFLGVDDVVVLVDTDGRYLDANPAMTVLVGYSNEGLRRMRVGDLSLDGATAQVGHERFVAAGRWRGESV